MSCEDRLVQLSALLDGELATAELAGLTAHLAACPACAGRLAELGALRAALAEAVPEEEISAEFLARIEAALDTEAAPAVAAPAAVEKNFQVLPFKRPRRFSPAFVSGAAAAAIAAMVLFNLAKPPANLVDLAAVRDAALRGTAAAGASIMPPDVADVPGFKLSSARRDIVAGHAAEVLDYAAARESITLCIWKANGEPAHAPRTGSYHGMNIVYWNDGSKEYWAAANLPMANIEAFGQWVRSRPG